MKVQKSWLLACVAGTCATTAAMAQTDLAPEALGSVQRVDPATGQILGAGYAGRVPGDVWDNYIFHGTGGAASIGAVNHHTIFYLNWAPGPWATQANHMISGVNIVNRRNAAIADQPCQTQLRFYNVADVNLAGWNGTGTSMINPGPDLLPNTPDDAQPVAQINLGLPAGVNDALLHGYGYNLGVPVSVPAGEYYIDARVVDNATLTVLTTANDVWRLATGSASNAQGGGILINPCVVGTGRNDMGYDADNNGWIAGNPVPLGTSERRAYTVGGAASTTCVGFVGDIEGSAPTCGVEAENLALGADNAFVSDAETLAGGTAKIYCVTLPSAAVDANLKYIDIDTEGSTGDVMIAVYDAEGNLAAFDDGSGSGTNDQLSFGIGRRPAVGDGLQYDGRDWNDGPATVVLGLDAGVHYIYVAPVGTTFAPGFSVTPGAAGGDFTLRVRTNAAGGALDPSVPPVSTRLTGPGGEDPLVSPGAQSTLTDLDGPGVLWYDVNLCEASSASAAITFDLAGTTAPTHVVNVFNASGNRVGTATGTAAAPAILTFTDLPVLAAGHYYVGMTYQAPVDLAPDPETNGRWHMRSRNASGLAFQLSVLVTNSVCPGPTCDPDFNCDGNVDQDDVGCMINVVAGNPGCECADPDFNRDGNVDQEDVASIINVVAGGPCP